ncbi:alpha-L-rhamnosidase [Catenovulum agarivorans DS-2]|uniref:alpha-L-rhamnosidase n=1 Tax=Catenovulum agarivorans DS-2 TaxID=1328313 RepID=W7QCB5_9ALTE|nr:family 78 glycoside hydrolase catalytic domain [Catenovulum agarivorans]EWH10529.1 alpha-L-rhamnosidase [Catenovulum agarivorans DS-2]
MHKYLMILPFLITLLGCLTLPSKPMSGKQTAQILFDNPTNLLTEGLVTPLNIHNQTPRLSWHANVQKQTAYQVQVATSIKLLNQGAADLWDSGKVESSQSININYQGLPLTTNQKVFWRVRVWQKHHTKPSQWSEASSWQMGLLNASDWQAKWIKAAAPTIAKPQGAVAQWIDWAGSVVNKVGRISKPAIDKLENQPTASLFRHSFSLNKQVKSARLHSTAAGYYEIYINGQRISNRLMDPGQTDFDKRILYNTDLVASYLSSGENAIAVHLGSGWYDENIAFSLWVNPDKKPTGKTKPSLSYGQPKFIAQLDITFTDGTTTSVFTDESWKSHPSHILKEGLFSGELFDQNQFIQNWNSTKKPENITQWQPVSVLQKWPTKVLEPQLQAPIRTQQQLKPIALLNPEKGVWVWDFGQNFTGQPSLNIQSLNLAAGQAIYLRYAEWADNNGNISQLSGGPGATHLNAVDGFVAASNSAKHANQTYWQPKFTWRGFRYVEIRGLSQAPKLTDLTAKLIRSDVTRVGQFDSSDPLINRIHQTALWSYESNLMSVPLDCPIREKAGWTGDAHAALITGNYNFDMENFWRKYLRDFQTAKYVAPAVVPGKRTLGEKVDWAAAEVLIAWENYRHHGDKQTLQEQYTSLLEYMAYGETQLTDYLTTNGFGDWCDPVPAPGVPRVGGRGRPQQTSTLVTSSALFAHASDLMAKIADVLNKQADAERFSALFNNIKNSFHNTLYDPVTGHYGSQTADAMALRFGIVPVALRQSVAAALNKDVLENWHGHYSVGALGQTYLYRALSDYGYADTAFNIFKAKGYPGFDYLFNELKGTTLWERKGQFDPEAGHGPINSLNHPFHSGYDGWFYEGIGGIRPKEDSVGFQNFELAPVFPTGLTEANVSYQTGYGIIKSHWLKKGNEIIWRFSVPNNTSAVVKLPNQADKLYLAGNYTVKIPLKPADNQAKAIALDVAPSQLRVELLKGNVVDKVNDLLPEFSWQLASLPEFSEQTAYQIQIIDAVDRFDAEQPNFVWDSGKVASSQSVANSLFSVKLKPKHAYQWRVKVWSRKATEQARQLQPVEYESSWSAPQRFTVAAKQSELASTHDTQVSVIEPAFIEKLPSGRYLIDFGKVAFGYLELGLTSDKAGQIDVHFAERGIADGDNKGIITKMHKGTSVRYYKVPLQINAQADVYSVHPPRDKRNTKPEVAIPIPARFGRIAPFRFIEIDANGLNLSDIKANLIMLHYPFDAYQSSFSSSDSVLNQIWQLCKYSMKATSFAGVYVDGDRERIPYEADAYINQLSHYYVDDEFSLARHSHEYLMANSTWPTEWKQHSIMMAWVDWMHTGDLESLRVFYPQLKAQKLLSQYENDLGLLTTFPKRIPKKQLGDLVDWPPNERDNYDMRPVNTVVNAFYYLNLKQMADMAKALGLMQEHLEFKQKAQRVYQAFNQQLFNPTTGLYIDGVGSNHSAVHANILPLAFGLVPNDKKPKILKFIKQKGMAVSVYFAQYLMEALYLNAEADYALSLLTSTELRSWYNMIRQGSTITMEAWDDKFKPNQDWNHAWGAVPGNIVGRFLLGVRPQTAGFKQLIIAPQPSTLAQVSGTVPTIRGPVRVAIEQTLGKSFELELSIPGNTQATVILPWQPQRTVTALQVNQQNVDYKMLPTGIEITGLSSGHHKIKLNYQ